LSLQRAWYRRPKTVGAFSFMAAFVIVITPDVRRLSRTRSKRAKAAQLKTALDSK
jgi:hypothetical protein